MYQDLLSAVALSGQRALLRAVATYQPAGGVGAKVFPPTYPTVGDRPPYVVEERLVDGKPRGNVLLDSTPSQANRAEEALLRAHRDGAIRVPLMTLEHAGEVAVTLTSLEFPHRYADAYLRDSLLDGVAFDRTELGRSLMSASLEDARALYVHDPGSLVFGAWNSHRKGRQQKFPRVYASEVVGWDPVMGARSAGRMDPLNLTGAQKSRKDGEGWDYSPVATKAKGEKLSEIGHGNVAPNPQHGGVTVSSAQRIATLSLAGLDRIGFGRVDAQVAVAARAVLAAYAIMADRLAFGSPTLWLRSGCELVLESERLEWVNRGGGTEQLEITRETAVELFTLASRLADKQGLALSDEPVRLAPSKALAQAIDFSLTKAAAGEGEA
ncbi:MAG TPA: type I-U CRISPR-associated RAMP protein Csb1/Cas7u [Micromonosporaceae bacterium]|nr:type I-U CRISPR-associated RAMP protein Csb1/Cas7u [Micromonosporaceae bacterium]